MFHSRKMEHSINIIHERALCLIYPSDSKVTFKELLDKNKTVSIHQKTLQVLATEIFKAKLNTSPEILKELFSFKGRLIKKNKLVFDILFSLTNNDEQRKTHLKIFIRSRDNCN